MTRINTNVSALVARNTLGRSNASLEQALTRLSTGLRINTGKDDPAGLIASENLRSDITSIKKAIGNTDRANQVIATADSALGQVSSLLNDIRGLVTESANAGALSQAQLDANQLQIDSSLEALNRIAQTTTFQGRKLLDGSLDFTTTAGTNFTRIDALQIDQANLGATGAVPVTINVTDAATKAQVNVPSVPTGSGTGVAATTTASFNSQAEAGTAAEGTVGFTVATATSSGTVAIGLAEIQSTGTLTFDTTTTEAIVITALNGGAADGAIGGASGGIDVVLVQDVTNVGAVNGAASSYNAGTNTITLAGDFTSGTLTSAEVAAGIAAIGGGADFTATGGTANNLVAADVGTYANVATGGRAASTENITVTGAQGGTSGNITIAFTEGGVAGTATAVSGGYSIALGSSNVTISAIAGYVNSLAEVNATTSSTATYNIAADSVPGTAASITGGAQTSNSIDITSLADASGSNLNLTFQVGGSAGVAAGSGPGDYTITYTAGSTLNDILSLVETIAEVDDAETALASGSVGTRVVLAAPSGVNNILGYTAPVLGDDVITITSDTVGTAGNTKTVSIAETSNTSLFSATTGVGAVVDSNGNITVSLDNTRTDIDISDIANAIDGLAGYTATVSTAGGGGVYDSTTQTAPTVANTANGAAAGGLAGGVVFELAGLNGSEVLSFGIGTSLTQLVDGINLVKDATGVEAEAAGTTLQLRSTDYGSTAIVDLKVISEDNGATLFTGVADKRDEGTDISATVNGVVANGKGNQLTINTATLDLKASIEADFEGISSFTIVGGGALFQLGPDVVSNQQARLGVTSVNTARLGGVAGKLYELANGNAASLGNDPTSAARIVEEAIDQITSLRGRLGAFQRTTLETNKNALNDTLVNLSDAESSIRDADFAEESAALTRAQILVQAGSTVLQIANSNPQNVLALLR